MSQYTYAIPGPVLRSLKIHALRNIAWRVCAVSGASRINKVDLINRIAANLHYRDGALRFESWRDPESLAGSKHDPGDIAILRGSLVSGGEPAEPEKSEPAPGPGRVVVLNPSGPPPGLEKAPELALDEPKASPASKKPGGLEGALLEVIQGALSVHIEDHLAKLGVTRDGVAKLIAAEVAKASIPRRLEIKAGAGDPVEVPGVTHPAFPRLMRALSAGLVPYLHGPAGSGKSFAIRQAAAALEATPCLLACNEELPSYYLTGYHNASGEYCPTEFYKAWCGEGEYSGGALIFIDEADRGPGGVMVGLNPALADEREFSFPCGTRKAASGTLLALAGNTIMSGADAVYAGAQRQDGALRNRVAWIRWDYDTDTEKIISDALAVSLDVPVDRVRRWRETVYQYRKAVAELRQDYAVGPRQLYNGVKLLAAGADMDETAEVMIAAGIDPDDLKQIEAKL